MRPPFEEHVSMLPQQSMWRATYDIVEVAGKHHSLDLETSGGDLGDKCVANGSDSQIIYNSVDQEDRAKSPSSTSV